MYLRKRGRERMKDIVAVMMTECRCMSAGSLDLCADLGRGFARPDPPLSAAPFGQRRTQIQRHGRRRNRESPQSCCIGPFEEAVRVLAKRRPEGRTICDDITSQLRL